jgi:hypothetical protein
VNPTALMLGAGKDLLDRLPEAERTVADREIGRDLEPTHSEFKKHVVLPQISWNMSRGHLYRTRLREIVLRGRTTAFTIGMKMQNESFKFELVHQFVDHCCTVLVCYCSL